MMRKAAAGEVLALAVVVAVVVLAPGLHNPLLLVEVIGLILAVPAGAIAVGYLVYLNRRQRGGWLFGLLVALMVRMLAASVWFGYLAAFRIADVLPGVHLPDWFPSPTGTSPISGLAALALVTPMLYLAWAYYSARRRAVQQARRRRWPRS
jgi:hypothetical protein